MSALDNIAARFRDALEQVAESSARIDALEAKLDAERETGHRAWKRMNDLQKELLDAAKVNPHIRRFTPPVPIDV
jgi:chromosome segregation ATPase